MVLAIGGTILQLGIEGKIEHISISYSWIFLALGIGTAIGVPLGLVQMTAVPQRTALSHAFGAFCVTLVGTAEYYLGTLKHPRLQDVRPLLEVILGGLTVTGSLMAAGKLQEVLPQRPITYKGQNFVNLALLAFGRRHRGISGPQSRRNAPLSGNGRHRSGGRSHAGHPHRRR